MKQIKPKVLAISFPEDHFELHDIIVENAAKNRVTVSHYTRSLLYACMDRVECKGKLTFTKSQESVEHD